jgi:DNA-binding MarR family transcriptional regulator
MPDGAHAPDAVDLVIGQWRRERPDLDLDAMATFGRLGRVAAHLTRAVEAVPLAHGLTLGEADVLWCLRRTGEPFTLTPSVLARNLLLSPAGTTNRIDRLEAAGLVERRLDPDDRRSFLVRLTVTGRAVADQSVAEHVANEAHLLQALGPAGRKAFDRALRTLLGSLEGDEPS